MYIFLRKELLQNQQGDVKVMKKQLMIIGIIVLLVCVGLCGCTNPLSDRDKFVGA